MDHSIEDREWLESLKAKGMNLGLERTKAYVDRLGIPWPEHVFHVAGSNGKGTACAQIVACLRGQGMNTLLFSSPHLIRVEERTRYNGKPISSSLYSKALRHLRHRLHDVDEKMTFFEATYLVTLECLRLLDVDALILETGLGGRLDATRTAPATCCVVTSISLEHTDVLGHRIEDIAREKAGIARPKCPIFVKHPHSQAVQEVFEDVASNPTIIGIDELEGPSHLQFIDTASSTDYIDEAQLLIHQSLHSYLGIECGKRVHQVSWPGRQQLLQHQDIEFFLEGAHNPSGMGRALESMVTNWPTNWSLMFGTSPQQSMDDMIEPLRPWLRRTSPLHIILTSPQKGRYPGVQPSELRKYFESYNVQIIECEQPKEAIDHIIDNCSSPHRVLVIGSLYLQGNVLEALGYDSDEQLGLFDD